MSVEQMIINALLSYGAIDENWKIKITDIENLQHSDWAKVTTEIFKPRCRKPYAIWELVVNTVRNITDFEKSSFTRV